MVGIERIEKLVSREKKIFRFLIFYWFLALFLTLLFLNSGGWAFIQTAIIVLAMEIGITGFINRGKPLHTNEDVQKELGEIDEIDEYTQLRDEYINNKDNTITIALIVYFLGTVVFLFFKNFSLPYLTLFITGFLILYFSVYLLFRYKINKVTMILLQRRKVIREMKMEKSKKEKERKKKREKRRLNKLRELASLRRKKKKKKPKPKKTKKPAKKQTKTKKKKPKKLKKKPAREKPKKK
ncbi:MAG: hypothetical protein JSV92_03665 [archaeon]|nr:MAG: hypothetical protein JSV92_03665 [archaeon]